MRVDHAPQQGEEPRFAKLEDLERRLAAQRTRTVQLGREREILLARIADAERRRPGDEEPHERRRADSEALREELARVDEARFDAHGRILRLEQAAAQLSVGRRSPAAKPGRQPLVAIAPERGRPGPLRSAALVATGLLALGGAAAAGAALRGSGEERPAAPAALQERPAPASGPVGTPPACSDADTDRPVGVVRCTTGRTLVIAAGDTPVRLPDLRVRVLRAERIDDRVDVRLRLDAITEGPRVIGAQQVFLGVGRQRLFGLSIGSPPRLRPGVPATLDMRFALTPDAVAALGRGDGRADLGVSPFARDARESGVIRLDLG